MNDREERTGRSRCGTITPAMGLTVLCLSIAGTWGVPAAMAGETVQMTQVAQVATQTAAAGKRKARGSTGENVAAGHASPTPEDDRVALNFRDAEIDSVIGAFGHLLDRAFVIDPRVRGKMTLETPRPVSREQAWRLLQSALRSQGFAVVETGTLTKVVPEAEAKLQSTPVSVAGSPAPAGEQIVTRIFRLNHESATHLVPVLRPLISPNNTVVAYPGNNSLVVTDYAANIERIGRIVATLDGPANDEVEVVAVRHAVAGDLAVTVQRLLQQQSGPGAQVDAGQRLTVMADSRSNAILLYSASAAKLGQARAVIAELDRPSARPGNINVVYLRNAEARKLAETLRGVLGGGDGSVGAGAVSEPMREEPLLQIDGSAGQALGNAADTALPRGNDTALTIRAGGAIIAADSSTNSLIITAPEPIYRNLRAVIDRLDTRRAQVFIESLIVEVSAEKAAELGVQWQFLGSPQGSTRALGGTNFGVRGAGSNILDAAANIGAIGSGLNLGIVRGTVNVPGVGEILDLGFLARALESGADANILATPNLLTLDNEEARIIIGQNVPFVTGQFTATGTGGASVNPFQTIERRDVGTTLRVRPQVSESGTVRLQIFQEVSSVHDTKLAAGIITNRRAIETNVLVDDGQIIVLGGLIEERIDGSEDKVPGLGDVPLLGQLFRYDSRKRVKTNLLVFLRPIVIRDGSDAHGVTMDRYDYIRAVRAQADLPAHWALPDFRASPLPPLAPAPGGSSAAPAPAGAYPAPAPADAYQDPAPIVVSHPSTVLPAAGTNVRHD